MHLTNCFGFSFEFGFGFSFWFGFGAAGSSDAGSCGRQGDGGGVSECGVRDLGSGLVFWSGLSFNFIPHFMHTGQVFFFSPKGFFDMLPFKAKYNV